MTHAGIEFMRYANGEYRARELHPALRIPAQRRSHIQLRVFEQRSIGFFGCASGRAQHTAQK